MQVEPDNKSCKALLCLLKSRQAKLAKPSRAKLQDNPLITERKADWRRGKEEPLFLKLFDLMQRFS